MEDFKIGDIVKWSFDYDMIIGTVVNIDKDKIHCKDENSLFWHYCNIEYIDIVKSKFQIDDYIKYNGEIYLVLDIKLNSKNDFEYKFKKIHSDSYCYFTEDYINRSNKFKKCGEKNGFTVTLGKTLTSTTYEPYTCLETTTKVKGNWEENKMDCKELLKKWLELNNEKIKEETAKKRKELIETDEIVTEGNKIIDTIQSLTNNLKEKYNKPNAEFQLVFTNKENLISEETQEAINSLEKESSEQLKLNTRIANEVSSATSICENEESLRKVLKTYEIIDKNGKINVK